jgi:hypothetical protein
MIWQILVLIGGLIAVILCLYVVVTSFHIIYSDEYKKYFFRRIANRSLGNDVKLAESNSSGRRSIASTGNNTRTLAEPRKHKQGLVDSLDSFSFPDVNAMGDKRSFANANSRSLNPKPKHLATLASLPVPE